MGGGRRRWGKWGSGMSVGGSGGRWEEKVGQVGEWHECGRKWWEVGGEHARKWQEGEAG